MQLQEHCEPSVDDIPLNKRLSCALVDNSPVISHVPTDAIIPVISHALIVDYIEEIFRAWILSRHVFSCVTRNLLGLKSASSTIAHVDPLLT